MRDPPLLLVIFSSVPNRLHLTEGPSLFKCVTPPTGFMLESCTTWLDHVRLINPHFRYGSIRSGKHHVRQGEGQTDEALPQSGGGRRGAGNQKTTTTKKEALQLLFPRAQNKCNDLSNVTRKQFGLGYWILTVWPLALWFKQFVCFTPQARLSPEWALRSSPSSSWCSPFVWREHPPRKKEPRRGRKKGSRFTARRKYGTLNSFKDNSWTLCVQNKDMDWFFFETSWRQNFLSSF